MHFFFIVSLYRPILMNEIMNVTQYASDRGTEQEGPRRLG
jgi:hypothetical protein